MITLGISEGFHNSSVCYVEDGEILFASESERYTGIKNDKWVPGRLLDMYDYEQVSLGKKLDIITTIAILIIYLTPPLVIILHLLESVIY